MVPVSLYSLHPYGCAKCFIKKHCTLYLLTTKNINVMKNLNDLFISEQETVNLELQSLTDEAQSNNLDMKKLLRPLNDYSENNLSSVGHGTYYATQYGTSHNTCSHLTCRRMAHVDSWRMMHMGRHRFTEEFIGVIVAIIVSPASVHIVCPTSVMMIPHTPFPPRNIASACYAGRSTLH